MADLPDVEIALVSTIATALYPPNGTATAGQSSVTGYVCKVYRGWPVPLNLDADLAAGLVNISVYPEPGGDRNTTRAMLEWKESIPPNPQIQLSVVQNIVTISGSIQAGDLACIKVAHSFFPVQVTTGQTLSVVASALAALIAVTYPGTNAVGSVITIPTSSDILVANGGLGTAWMETRRQSQIFQITAWCPTPAIRDVVGPFIKTLFAGIERIVLDDDSYASVSYQRSIVSDKNQTQQCYRRDFLYTVEFPSTQTQQFPSITAFAASTTGGVSPGDTPAPVVTVV